MTYVSRSEKSGVGHLSAPRPAQSLIPHLPSLKTVIAAVFRRVPRARQQSVEERLAAQARREAHRRTVDRLWIDRQIF